MEVTKEEAVQEEVVGTAKINSNYRRAWLWLVASIVVTALGTMLAIRLSSGRVTGPLARVVNAAKQSFYSGPVRISAQYVDNDFGELYDFSLDINSSGDFLAILSGSRLNEPFIQAEVRNFGSKLYLRSEGLGSFWPVLAQYDNSWFQLSDDTDSLIEGYDVQDWLTTVLSNELLSVSAQEPVGDVVDYLIELTPAQARKIIIVTDSALQESGINLFTDFLTNLSQTLIQGDPSENQSQLSFVATTRNERLGEIYLTSSDTISFAIFIETIDDFEVSAPSDSEISTKLMELFLSQ